MDDRLDPVTRASDQDREKALARERDRKDLREWLAEWRYWLGGGVIMSAVWGVQCLRKDELGFYWPVTPLSIWAAVLVAIAVWPRSGGGDGEG